MAKVYSWEVSKTPKKYAYIVSPKNLTDVYIGNELKGSNLEKVKEWAMNCTETEYEAQFEKMVAACASQGYNVEFESAVTYMNVDSTCDNLRGPAGRGIDRIVLYKKDGVQNISVYNIYYTDGTYDTLEVQNGFNGRDGIDGTPGAKGDSGVSSKFIMAYTSGIDEDGNRYTPSRPEGGSYDFTTNEMTYPDGWGANDEGITPPVWVSTRTFSTSETSTDKQWSAPTQITGENGLPGADGVTTEFIYYLDDSEPSVEGLPSPNEPGYVPDYDTYGWTGSPTGVDEDHLTEWCSLRKMNRETKEWGPWEKAFIWSKYGVNGQDGDGVQYIYLKNKGTLPLNPTPYGYDEPASVVYGAYQSKDEEWMPYVDTPYTNLDMETVIYEAGQENSGIWTDNPSDVTAEYHSLWVSSRKYRKNTETDKMEWGAFSNPALWSRFGQDGKNATSIRKLYALSTSTSNPPDLPGDSTYTGDWGTGFPVDYVSGENVVWGTEAEIWAHNYEFVMSYKMVSKKNANGEIVPPHDAEGNSVEMPELPSEERTDYKYIIVNGDYYEWTGGWCTPYLVTGVKGETISPVNYTIYVFCFGFADTVPAKPTGSSPTQPGPGSDGSTWADFPDTSDNKVDGATINGRKMRWYQCLGHIYGHNGEVYEWGDVSPCNGNDGAKGNYVEMRFAVTKDNKEPELIETDKVTGRILREPTLYDENGKQIGWFTTDNELPTLTSTGVMWQIWATINGEDDSVMSVNNKYWNGPRRVSGEKGDKGDQGIQGPAGKRGVTGIPGAQLLTMYCLGTYDAPFGSNAYESGVMPEELTDWYKGTEMPYADCLEARSDDDIKEYLADSAYKGRVIKLINTQQEVINGSTINNVTHTYYLITHNMTKRLLAQDLTPDASEEYNIYMWCIQGNQKWVAGNVKRYVDITRYENGDVIPPEDADENNTLKDLEELPTTKQELYKYIFYNNKYYEWQEIDGDDVQHNLVGVEWYKPFKTQGTNGLRGLTGSRGQVVYPMGVYNSEEVYITTEDKAPYVYDPNDGLYYVYNIVGTPWVGKLPNDFKLITKKDGSYKYSIDGTGNPLTWMTDQDGDTPANNYANLTNDNRKPAWVRFESFEALYTSIGIIENGMIGSAVYNNEFMFSQQGIDQDGNPTNYAVVSGSNTTYGFLSGYEYDEDGELGENGHPTGRHWKYRNTGAYIKDINVDPYEKDNSGQYIHTFMPNVCINFATGQMWTSCGKAHFNYDGTGYLADNAIRWGYEAIDDGSDNETIAFEIGVLNSDGITGNGIKYHNGNLTIGPFESFTADVTDTINEFKADQATQYQDFVDEVNSVVGGFQEQIDGKAETYYQGSDPSEYWTYEDTKAQHVGDLWYCTEDIKDVDGILLYEKGGTYIYEKNGNFYKWSNCYVPSEVFDKIDGKASIFTFEDNSFEKPTNYHIGDLWILQNDTIHEPDKKGHILTAIANSVAYNKNHWTKRIGYVNIEEANRRAEALASDGYITPKERRELKAMLNEIEAENPLLETEAQERNLTDEEFYTNYVAAYNNVYNTLDYYADKATPITGGLYDGLIKIETITYNEHTIDYNHIYDYNIAKENLLRLISSQNVENIQNKADNEKVEKFAKQLGYQSYDAMVETAQARETIINGGYINTSLIDVDTLIAHNAFIDVVRAGSAITNYIGVEGESDPINFPGEKFTTACLNGSEMGMMDLTIETGTGSYPFYSKLIFAAGIPCAKVKFSNGQVATRQLKDIIKDAKVRIYDTGYSVFNEIETNYIHAEQGFFEYPISSAPSLTVRKEIDGGTAMAIMGSTGKTVTGIKIDDTTTAIKCEKGVFAGLRPKITYITSGSNKLTNLEHTIVLNNETDDVIDITLPSSPQDGQEYIIYQVKKGGKFTIKSTDKVIFSMNKNSTTKEDPYTANVNRYVNIIYCEGLKQWISRYINYAE